MSSEKGPFPKENPLPSIHFSEEIRLCSGVYQFHARKNSKRWWRIEFRVLFSVGYAFLHCASIFPKDPMTEGQMMIGCIITSETQSISVPLPFSEGHWIPRVWKGANVWKQHPKELVSSLILLMVQNSQGQPPFGSIKPCRDKTQTTSTGYIAGFFWTSNNTTLMFPSTSQIFLTRWNNCVRARRRPSWNIYSCWFLEMVLNLNGGNSNIFYFHPYLGKWSNLTNILQTGWNHQLVNGCWSIRSGQIGRSRPKFHEFFSPQMVVKSKGNLRLLSGKSRLVDYQTDYEDSIDRSSESRWILMLLIYQSSFKLDFYVKIWIYSIAFEKRGREFHTHMGVFWARESPRKCRPNSGLGTNYSNLPRCLFTIWDEKRKKKMAQNSWELTFECSQNPYHPCMVYLPTFTIKINQM